MTDASTPTVRYWRLPDGQLRLIDPFRDVPNTWTEVRVLSDAELDAIKAEVAEKARADERERMTAEHARLKAQVQSLTFRGSTGYASPLETWPDDTEIDECISEAESLRDALFDISEKYGADVTNNMPRWQEGRFMRHVGDFISDVETAVEKHTGRPLYPTRTPDQIGDTP